jgi:signal transduction histidine kinase
MSSFWKNQGDRMLRAREKLTRNVFAMAHAKILISYVAIGLIITAVSGFLVYRNTISFAQDIITTVQRTLQSNTPADETLISRSILQVINSEIWRVNIAVGVSMLVVLSIFAYALARATLWPIEKAMKRQHRFSADIAHELRTPLAVMKTNFEVTLMGATSDTPEEFTNALRTGIEEIERMSSIAQFLLAFASFDRQHMKLEMSDIDLAAVGKETLHLMKPLIEQRDVTVTAHLEKPIMIRGNHIAIQEMLMNLIKNAMAYTPPGGFVEISGSIIHGIPTLSVSDTGIGIPATDLPNIFEPFFRGENAYSQRSKKRGSGLGLAIVKDIAAFHKAQVLVTSNLGKGTTVSVRFPQLS